MSAVPAAAPGEKRQRIVLQNDVPNPATPPSGRAFHPRCRYAQDVCRTSTPELREITPGQVAACHFADTLSLAGVQDVH